MQEIWVFYKEILQTNQYLKKGDILTVSDWGRVKCNGEFYKCLKDKNGYYRLCGKLLHRIIAEKFLSDYYENCEIDHINTIPSDNRVENLCICHNHSQNNNNPLTIQHFIESSHKKPVLQYTKDCKFVAEYTSAKNAERQTNIYQGNISQCCNQKRKSAGGYIWKYKNI
jgi:hypothetical protein